MQNDDCDVFNEYTLLKTDKLQRVCAYCDEKFPANQIDILSKHSNEHAGFKKYDLSGKLIPGSPETALANFMAAAAKQQQQNNDKKETMDKIDKTSKDKGVQDTSKHTRSDSGRKIRKVAALNKEGRAVGLLPYICDCSTISVRIFHIAWITFFNCFFVWFSISNLSMYISQDLNLSDREQSIALDLRALSTIIFRIIFGDLCDKIGARHSYVILLSLSFISFVCVSFSFNAISYYIFSFFTGIIGASFVITEYHVAQFFSTKSVGMASALSAGWGNFGGGVAQIMVPVIHSTLINRLHVSLSNAWRYTLLILSVFLFFNIFVYYFKTSDTPNGDRSNVFNIKLSTLIYFDLSKYKKVCRDYRIWVLALAYAVCFGVEVTVLNYFMSYFTNQFGLSADLAGFILFCFSSINLFARGFGGFLSDLLYSAYGIQGRIYCLFMVLLAEALFISMFALSAFHLGYTLMLMIFFSCYVQIAEGVVFSIIPSFSNMKKYHGLYMGFIGAGGNLGAMIYSLVIFDNAPHIITYANTWIILAMVVFISSFIILCVKYTKNEVAVDTENVDKDIWLQDKNNYQHEF